MSHLWRTAYTRGGKARIGASAPLATRARNLPPIFIRSLFFRDDIIVIIINHFS